VERQGEDGSRACAGWLAANSDAKHSGRDPKLLFNLVRLPLPRCSPTNLTPSLSPPPPPPLLSLCATLQFPGGGAQIQRSAEGAVVQEAVKAEQDWHATWKEGPGPKLTGKVCRCCPA